MLEDRSNDPVGLMQDTSNKRHLAVSTAYRSVPIGNSNPDNKDNWNPDHDISPSITDNRVFDMKEEHNNGFLQEDLDEPLEKLVVFLASNDRRYWEKKSE